MYTKLKIIDQDYANLLYSLSFKKSNVDTQVGFEYECIIRHDGVYDLPCHYFVIVLVVSVVIYI